MSSKMVCDALKGRRLLSHPIYDLSVNLAELLGHRHTSLSQSVMAKRITAKLSTTKATKHLLPNNKSIHMQH